MVHPFRWNKLRTTLTQVGTTAKKTEYRPRGHSHTCGDDLPFMSVRRHRDHPHIRGDDTGMIFMMVATMGPPPHTWGRLLVKLTNGLIEGITPTYVGTTANHSSNVLQRWDHPHIRGDDHCGFDLWVCRIGSPPHTWGRLLVARFFFLADRITPTYVGTTLRKP